MIRFGWVRVPGPLLPCADGRKYAEMISPQSCGAEMHQGGGTAVRNANGGALFEGCAGTSRCSSSSTSVQQ